MKKIASLFTLAAASLTLAACSTSEKPADKKASGDLLTSIQDKGVITVGTEGTYSPYTYHDESGKLVGYDVEVAEAVGEKLGVKVEFVETEWDSIISGLDAGRFDIIVNQVTITDERKEKYDFSTPYTYIYGVLLTSKDNKDIKGFDDIKGLKSANSLTSNWHEIAESHGAEIVGVDGFQQSVELIASGRADVTVNDNVAYYDYLKQQPDANLRLVTLTEDSQESAIMVTKGNDKLVAEIDKALAELAEEGVLTELSNKYFGSDVSQQAAE